MRIFDFKPSYRINLAILVLLTGVVACSSTGTGEKKVIQKGGDISIQLDTVPTGASCFLTGFENQKIITPTELFIPGSSRSQSFIVCNKAEFFETRSNIHAFIRDNERNVKMTIPLKKTEDERIQPSYSANTD